MELSEYAYLWTEPGWYLSEGSDGSCLPMKYNDEFKCPFALIIEIDEVAEAVTAEMRRRGVPVVRDSPPSELTTT